MDTDKHNKQYHRKNFVKKWKFCDRGASKNYKWCRLNWLRSKQSWSSFLELYNILVQIWFATSKTKLDIYCNKLTTYNNCLNELQNNLRKLGNQKMLKKYRNFVATLLSAQSPLQKIAVKKHFQLPSFKMDRYRASFQHLTRHNWTRNTWCNERFELLS